MRQETIVKTYLTFDELDEKQQEKVLEKYYYINVDHDWWDFTYEDAKNVGIIIEEFNLDRGSYCKIDFELSEIDTAKRIIKEHGPSCETYKTAQVLIDTIQRAEDDQEDYLRDFKYDLQEDYRRLLQNSYEYLTSEEAIKETILCNEYEFDIDTLNIG